MKNKRLVCVILILVIVLTGLYYSSTMYKEGFMDSEKKLIICKASWCGHCKKAQPEFEKLVAASPIQLPDGSKVTVKLLDDKDNKDEISQYKVKGYPTILYMEGEKKTEYSGPRTYDGVMQFLGK